MKILDKNTGDYVSLLYSILLINNKYSFLPELYDMLGEETTTQLLETFSGTQITFPTVHEIQRIGRDINIYLRLRNVKDKEIIRVVEELASKYLVSSDVIRKSYDKMKRQIKQVGIEFLV